MATVKRMFRLQKIKIDAMWQAIQTIANILAAHANDIPRDVLSDITDALEKMLAINERVDTLREKNINLFYNKLRNSYEGLYNLEVEDGKENEEEN